MAGMHPEAPHAHPDRQDVSPPAWLYVITTGAILAGLWARFKGLGTWPLNADEYYIARSVENVLRSGLPHYDCGGFYIRGLTFQYLVAPLQWAGLSAEFSARLIAALSSVLVLPAVYRLGVRLSGRSVALLAVSAMALSVWEVDIARFGRMYAPFQAVFAWYLVFFLRYVVDRDQRARWPMLVLSVLGLFTWEGGLLLLAVNLLPAFVARPDGRFGASQIRDLLTAAGLLLVGFVATHAVDLRIAGTDPYPPGYLPRGGGTPGAAHGPAAMIGNIDVSPLALVALAVVAVLGLVSLRWVWSLRTRWPAALGMLVALGCALAHQFGLMIFLIAILLLAGMLHWRELFTRAAWPFLASIIAAGLAWTFVALSSPHWLASIHTPWETRNRVVRVAYELLKFPDLPGVVALPWARHAPVLGCLLLAALVGAFVRVVVKRDAAVTDERVMLLLIVCLLAGASMSNPPRFETRYTFFLYPPALLLGILAILRLVRAVRVDLRLAPVAAALLLAAALGLADELQPRRLLHIDAAEYNVGADTTDEDHTNVMYRADPRGAARWLQAQAAAPGTLLVNGYPGVDYYFRGFDYAYIDRGNQRFDAYACNHGTVERWGNLPLLSGLDELQTKAAGKDHAFLVIDAPSLARLRSRTSALQWNEVWTSVDGYIVIVDLVAPKS